MTANTADRVYTSVDVAKIARVVRRTACKWMDLHPDLITRTPSRDRGGQHRRQITRPNLIRLFRRLGLTPPGWTPAGPVGVILSAGDREVGPLLRKQDRRYSTAAAATLSLCRGIAQSLFVDLSAAGEEETGGLISICDTLGLRIAVRVPIDYGGPLRAKNDPNGHRDGSCVFRNWSVGGKHHVNLVLEWLCGATGGVGDKPPTVFGRSKQ